MRQFLYLLFLLSSSIVWKGAIIGEDGKVMGIGAPSPMYDAGIQVDDIVELVDGQRFVGQEQFTPATQYIVVRRNGKLIPMQIRKINRLVNTRTKSRNGL